MCVGNDEIISICQFNKINRHRVNAHVSFHFSIRKIPFARDQHSKNNFDRRSRISEYKNVVFFVNKTFPN